ncbi:hypothetical protein HK099_005225 [Clydaea vesicula]|uniref:Uncharacterized protein n=1 Tax=Clydaea vesicula TaxID=447962 RepID=A0AAD5UC43_9FUNG|nr:hypothetical protein HK099_005225 [Clydaea vesicula]
MENKAEEKSLNEALTSLSSKFLIQSGRMEVDDAAMTSSFLKKKPENSEEVESLAVVQNEEVDEVLAELLSMGFTFEHSEIALSFCKENRENGKSLLESCLNWCLAVQTDNGSDNYPQIKDKTVATLKTGNLESPPPKIIVKSSIMEEATTEGVTIDYSTQDTIATILQNSFFTLNNAATNLFSTVSGVAAINNNSTKENEISQPAESVAVSNYTETFSHKLFKNPFTLSENKSMDSLTDSLNNFQAKIIKFHSFDEDFKNSSKMIAQQGKIIEDKNFTNYFESTNVVNENEDSFFNGSDNLLNTTTSDKLSTIRGSTQKLTTCIHAKSAKSVGNTQYPDFLLEQYNFYVEKCQELNEIPIEKLFLQVKSLIDTDLSLNLTSLDLKNIPINSNNVASLSHLLLCLKFLSSANLENTSLEDFGLKSILSSILTSCCPFTWLSLANNGKIKFSGIKFIAMFIKKVKWELSKQLKFLDLTGLPIDRKGMSYISYSLGAILKNDMNKKSNKPASLEILKLDNSKLGCSNEKESIVEIFSKGLCKSNLNSLSLSCCSILKNDAKYLFESLRFFKDVEKNLFQESKIVSIDLTGNLIKEGVSIIAEALPNNQALKNLILKNNQINSEGLKILADGLKINTVLEKLDVSCNPLYSNENPEGIHALKDALYYNSTLLNLSLTNIQLTSEGAIALAESLPSVKSLRFMDISSNPINVAGVLAISISLKFNQSITSLEILPFLNPPLPLQSSFFQKFVTKQPQVFPKKNFEEEEEIAKYLNDIVIYCQRNFEIRRQKTREMSNLVLDENCYFQEQNKIESSVATPDVEQIILEGESTLQLFNDIVKEFNDTGKCTQDELLHVRKII